MADKLSNEEYAELWHQAESVQEVAAATGLTVKTARSRASYLRSQYGQYMKPLPVEPGGKLPVEAKKARAKKKAATPVLRDVKADPVSYCACAFDSFGAMEVDNLAEGGYRVRVRITTTKPCVVLFVKEHFGGEIRELNGSHGGVTAFQLVWTEGSQTHTFLTAISDHCQCDPDRMRVVKQWLEFGSLFQAAGQEMSQVFGKAAKE